MRGLSFYSKLVRLEVKHYAELARDSSFYSKLVRLEGNYEGEPMWSAHDSFYSKLVRLEAKQANSENKTK